MTQVEWTGLFFPPQGGRISPALEVCNRCPVTAECLERANETPFERDGIWGGQTGRGRRAYRRTGRTAISYPPELRARGLRLYDAGWDFEAIAKRLGVPPQTPSNWVKNRTRGTRKRTA
jgi:hypothetical protein